MITRDAAGTSVTIVNYGPWYARDAVAVYGERNLWAEVVDAHATWLWLDRPANTVQSVFLSS